jgi:signal transduction histidine kinase
MINRLFSIQFRLVLAFCALAVFTISICLGAYYWLAAREMQTRRQRELNTAAHVQAAMIDDKTERARLMARILASDPSVAQNIARSNVPKLDFILGSRALDMTADFLTVIDANGVILAQVEPASVGKGLQLRHGDPLFLDALFRRTLAGGSPGGLAFCRPGVVCINAFARVHHAGRIAGYVRVGFSLDNRFAGEMRSITGTDVILVREDRAAASSLPGEAPATSELRALADSMANPATHKKNREPQPAEDFEISLRNKPYLMRGSILTGADGRELGRLYIGRETTAEQRALAHAVRIMAIIAAVALPLSVIFGVALSVPIVRPLRLVLNRIHEVTRGDLRGELPVTRRDEVGLLAEAFNDMSRALDERDHALRSGAEALRINQDQLIQSGKLAALGELAAGVAHEIGNPLSAISGYAQMLRKGKIDDGTRQEFIVEIEKETEFIERIITDLLDFSRPSTGGPHAVDLEEALDAAIKTASAHKAFKNVSVARDFKQNIPPVLANRKEIMQVAINLVMNAAQAMPGGGEISITATHMDDYAAFSVADQGPGVPDHLKDKIFDPFFTTKPTGVGTGLGLSICYRIIEKLGGRISYSLRPGGGAMFMVTLPAAGADGPLPDQTGRIL